MKELIIIGQISDKGRLQGVFNAEYDKFMTDNAGERVSIEITLLGKKGSILQEVYWRKVVLRSLQRGFKETGEDMTMEETHQMALSLCPAIKISDTEEKLNSKQWSDLIEWAIRYCSVNFQIVVQEPNAES